MSLYVAIDSADRARAEALARTVAPHVGGLKLGLEFFMANGPDGVRRMGEYGLPIFLDVKLHDIGNTVAGAMRALAPLGVAVVNVHAAIGEAALRAARDAMPSATAIIAVTVLTSFDGADLRAIGVPVALPDQVLHLAAMTRRAGLQGVVCAGSEARAVRDRVARGGDRCSRSPRRGRCGRRPEAGDDPARRARRRRIDPGGRPVDHRRRRSRRRRRRHRRDAVTAGPSPACP